VDPRRSSITLALQFYKWGDGGPENALAELAFLSEKAEAHHGLLPVVWLDDLLREQLRDLYLALPDHFSLATFLFLLQRSNEEIRRWTPPAYSRLPEEQRPDYRLGFATGYAEAVNGFQPRRHTDPHLNRLLSFIAAGHFVRPWKHYGLRLSVLEWLQYLTQPTFENDMGSILGDFRIPYRDINFLYRFFIWSGPNAPFLIDRIAVELCDRNGADLLSTADSSASDPWSDPAYRLTLAEELSQEIHRLGADTYSLKAASECLRMNPDRFWKLQNYERPPLVPETQSTAVP
jgi:hypothetical protein